MKKKKKTKAKGGNSRAVEKLSNWGAVGKKKSGLAGWEKIGAEGLTEK